MKKFSDIMLEFKRQSMSSDELLILASEFQQISNNLKELALEKKKDEDSYRKIQDYIKRSHELAIQYYFGKLKKIPKGFSEFQLNQIAHSHPIRDKIRKIEQEKLGLEIIRLFRRGLTRPEISRKLNLSVSTVDKYYKKTFFR